MPLLHAKLSASGSHRWLNCTGSVKAEESIPDKTHSAAQEGSAAHELADICLTNNETPDKYLGQVIEGVKVDAEMVEHVQGYVDYVRSFKGDLMPEQQVDFSNWVPKGFGTSDAIVIDGDKVHVIDLKYGKGVVVSAENNTQAMLYALGVWSDYEYLFDEPEKVVFDLHIYQPRVNNFSVWSITLPDLLKWSDFVVMKADEALSEDAPRTAGDKQCTFCKAKDNCQALYEYTSSIIMTDFDDLDDLPAPNSITKAQMVQALKGKKLIESWLKAVEHSLYEKITSGEKVDGFKVVAGRSLRKWKNEEIAIKFIEEQGHEAYTKKALSPSQATKLLGKGKAEELQEFITKPEGKPTMVSSDDPRQDLNDISNCFENIVDN